MKGKSKVLYQFSCCTQYEFSELGGILKRNTQSWLGGVHFTYPPADVRLEVSMVEGQVLDAAAGNWDQSERIAQLFWNS